jgi:membrane associated rhomboid family serine protease
VAWYAHIGGLIAGAVLVVFFKRRDVPLFDKGMRVA